MFRFEIGSAGLASLAAGVALTGSLLFLSGLALGLSRAKAVPPPSADSPVAGTMEDQRPDVNGEPAESSGSAAADSTSTSRTASALRRRSGRLSSQTTAYRHPEDRRLWSSLAVPRAGTSLVRPRSRTSVTPTLAYRPGQGIPPTPFGRLIYQEARRRWLNPALVAAVVSIESGFDPSAVSPKGAIGLMQVIPDTATRFGVDPLELKDPNANLMAGTRYLRWLSARYDGDFGLTLAAYNAGDGAVDRWGGVPPYNETRNYVRKVYSALTAFQLGTSG